MNTKQSAISSQLSVLDKIIDEMTDNLFDKYPRSERIWGKPAIELTFGDFRIARDELTRLRTRNKQLEAALVEALEAFQILADAPKEGGWITVAPQFVYANLAMLKARLLADEQPADAGEGG